MPNSVMSLVGDDRQFDRPLINLLKKKKPSELRNVKGFTQSLIIGGLMGR